MTANEWQCIAIGIMFSMLVYTIIDAVNKHNDKKGIPKDADPWAKLDEICANIEKNCNELDTLINELKKSYK